MNSRGIPPAPISPRPASALPKPPINVRATEAPSKPPIDDRVFPACPYARPAASRTRVEAVSESRITHPASAIPYASTLTSASRAAHTDGTDGTHYPHARIRDRRCTAGSGGLTTPRTTHGARRTTPGRTPHPTPHIPHIAHLIPHIAHLPYRRGRLVLFNFAPRVSRRRFSSQLYLHTYIVTSAAADRRIFEEGRNITYTHSPGPG